MNKYVAEGGLRGNVVGASTKAGAEPGWRMPRRRRDAAARGRDAAARATRGRDAAAVLSPRTAHRKKAITQSQA